MPFLAHAAIQLAYDECPKDKNTWHFIKECDGIEYRWKFRSDYSYHIIAGLFNDPNDALKCAKQIYVTMVFEFLRAGFLIDDAGCSTYETTLFRDKELTVDGYDGDELYFFWNKYYQGGGLGPGVYEVETSLDEYDEYKTLSSNVSIIRESELNFENIDEYYFSYCREAQKLFNTIMLAEQADSYGMKMTIFCGLLEHLSETQDKEQEVLNVIDQLSAFVDSTDLSQEKKNSLKNYLNSGKKISARQKCLRLCEKYAKASYGGFECNKIINAAYSLRSSFSHGESNQRHSKCSAYIKLIVLDVIKNYMREKESQPVS